MRSIQNPYVLCALLAFCSVGCSQPTDPAKSIKEPPKAVPTVVPEPSQASRLVKVAASQVGVLEVPRGTNRGPQVDAYNLTCGKDMLGAPWCASFTRWCMWQIDIRSVPGAWSPSWYEAKRKIQPNEVKAGDQGLIYFQTLGRYAHVVAAVETVRRREVTTIEGNSNAEGGRDGFGVFRRVRATDSLTFVRWIN